MRWAPHLTVAAVVARDGRFLVVEESIDGRVVCNQPAGHLDPGESLCAAIVREMLEETARHFVPGALTGIYRWVHPASGATFVRVCFTGEAGDAEPGRALDDGILGTRWLSRDALAAEAGRLRSPLVLRCIDDYLAGARHPLGLLVDLDDG
jgi:8-oxo-dGTP pyrophosphatase MutT (NUDIX family)